VDVEISELNFCYRGASPARGLVGLSLALQQGERLAILGESGAGKSSLLRLIAGLERPESGTIKIGNTLMASASTWVPPENRNVGMVFQDLAVFPHLNVEANISFGLRAHRSKKDCKTRVQDLLTMFELCGLERRYPHELSGGQLQRVAVARSLAPSPRVLLLDEPFSSLDTDLRQRVQHQVRAALQAEEKSCILVTHDHEEALEFGHRICTLIDGKLRELPQPPKPKTHGV
jgi:iron(III) transport system ATP-binding protein